MLISKSFHFYAAHRLISVPKGHPCHNLHGHRYEVMVELKTDGSIHEDLERTMLIDYADLNPLKLWVKEVLDHSTMVVTKDEALTDLIAKGLECGEDTPFGKVFITDHQDTTAEILSEILLDEFIDILRKTYKGQKGLEGKVKMRVTVKESPTTTAVSSIRKVW